MDEHIICLDIGDARIGVAASDASRLIATPVDTIYRVGYGPDVKKVLEICRKYDTTQVLSGWPLNMDGTAGFQAQKVQQFCEQLEKAGLRVYYQDERLTTVTAQKALIEGGMRREDRKHHVDKVAAAVILQQWLDTCRARKEAEAMDEQEKMAFDNEDQGPDDNMIELVDDETGDTVRFTLLASIEYENEWYIAVSDEENQEEGEDCGVYILQVVNEADGSESYVQVEDEAVQQAVFDKFLQMLEEEND